MLNVDIFLILWSVVILSVAVLRIMLFKYYENLVSPLCG
jgi:hypothetical protein